MRKKIKIIVELAVSLIMIYLVIISTTLISCAPYEWSSVDYSNDFIGPIQEFSNCSEEFVGPTQVFEDLTTTIKTTTMTESAAATTSPIISAILTTKTTTKTTEETTQSTTTNSTSKKLTQAATTLSLTTTLKTTTTKITTTEPTTTTTTQPADKISVGNARGTYYIPTPRQRGKTLKGGSGRYLIDCSVGNSEVKGSVASCFIYKQYGYNYNDKRTMLYLEVEDYPEMNGYYYLDDCDSGRYNLIDFFYYNGSTCPFSQRGVVKVKCYVVNY